MKLLLVLLSVILMGDICQGQEEWYEDPWEDYQPGPDLLEMIRQTALGKEISDKVSEGASAVGQHLENVGRKAEPALLELSNKIEEETDRFASEVNKHVSKKLDDLGLQVGSFGEEIQKNAIALVQSINVKVTESADTIRKEAKTLIESVGQSVQTQIVSFWKSLTSGN